MTGPYLREQIENWVSDYCAADSIRAHPRAVVDAAASVLIAFYETACKAGGSEPAEIEEPGVKAGLEALARLNLAPEVRSGVPRLVGSFLEFLQDAGRLGGGRALGAYIRALAPSFAEISSQKPKPFANPGSRLGRNDPCPCGSGLKYKKCCMGG